MLLSMTGFGRAEQAVNDKTFLVEIRSLNGKQFDLRLLMPALLKPYEFDIRSMILEVSLSLFTLLALSVLSLFSVPLPQDCITHTAAIKINELTFFIA